MAMHENQHVIETIKEKAAWMRRSALQMVYDKQLGHIGGDFSATDIIATLLFGVMNYDPKDPRAATRDRFIMSKGHATGALYTGLSAARFFPQEWLSTYMEPNSKLNGHPNRNYLPGIETNTGPLGHGLPVSVGIAISAQMDGATRQTYILTGDGELQEGSNWEAAMLAGHRKLHNLTLIVDRNRLQQGAPTEETNGLDALDAKFSAFGWDVEMADGHDHAELYELLTDTSRVRERPRCIIANTVKGKGVSFMENDTKWHHGVPNEEQYSIALRELA